MHWANGYGGSGNSTGDLRVAVHNSTNTFYYDSDWQSDNGVTQAPYTNGTGTAPWATHPIGGVAGYEVTQGGFATSSDGWNGTPVEEYIYVHDSVKAPCNHNWEKTSTIATGSIAATNETGVPETLVLEQYYELIVWGGPWNDGSADRYDVATKVDNSPSPDWTPLSTFATTNLSVFCTEGDPLDPTKTIVIFQALDTNPAHTDYPWRIRVNDGDGQFADNTGSMQFELDQLDAVIAGCQTRYLAGAKIGAATINATVSTGIHIAPGASPGAGDTYTWTPGNTTGTWIEIVTSDGPWQDGGAPPDRYDISIKKLDGTWEALSGSSNAACVVNNGNYIQAFYQLPDNNGIWLRVNDTGGTFTDNTGSMGVTVYSAINSPIPPAGCAETFQLGDLIKTVTVNANIQLGQQVGSLFSGTDVTGGAESGYIAIETSGTWFDGTTSDVLGAIATAASFPQTSDFSNLQTAPNVVCAVPLDPIGHLRVYIPISSDTDLYWVRAQDLAGNWTDNSGSLTFSFYKALDLKVPGYTPGTMPGAGLCDSYYQKGTESATRVIYGNDEVGSILPYLTQGMQSGKMYALETQAGPWQNNAVDSYEVAISDDNGLSWTNLMSYASAACAQSEDGLHILVFFQALTGRNYKIRVYDPGEVFDDNTGSINLVLWSSITETNLPGQNCADSYTVAQVTVNDNKIPVNNAEGVLLPDIEIGSGRIYAIEISGASYWWNNLVSDDHRFDAMISNDNGSTWSNFAPGLSFASCVIQTNTATTANLKTYKIYFTAPVNYVRMKLNDNGILSSGHLEYILYAGDLNSTPGQPCTNCHNPSSGPVTPPGWDLACYETYLRPSSLFKMGDFQLPSISFGSLGTITFPVFSVPIPAVDDWIAYLEWSIRSYFAWCAEDTAALRAIPTTLSGYEPFGTVTEIVGIFTTLENDVTAMGSSGGAGQNYAPYSVVFGSGGGEDGGANGFQGILPVLTSDSPWLGGGLKWGSGTGGEAGGSASPITTLPPVAAAPGIDSTSSAYITYCSGIMTPHIGAQASTGLCGAIALAKTAPLIWTLFQLCGDVGSILIFIQYIQRRWINQGVAS
jgi:hypothetical protein